MAVDVQALGADFFTFSGHKCSGVLYGRRAPSAVPPFLAPAATAIRKPVEEQGDEPPNSPPNLKRARKTSAGQRGLPLPSTAESVGFDRIRPSSGNFGHACRAFRRLSLCGALRLRRREANKTGIVTFNVKDVHPTTSPPYLGRGGRGGAGRHHCAQPLMTYLGQNACRASFYFTIRKTTLTAGSRR